MSKTINIPSGIGVIGNSLDTDLNLDTLNNDKIDSFKTLINGVWKSWSLGAPSAFQGFSTLNKGLGYVVNATEPTNITFNGNPLDINTLTINPGLNILALPYPDKLIADGYLPRFKISTLKTIEGSWKSWSAGTPDSFQGFTKLDNSKGYVANVEAVFDSFIDEDNKTINNGVSLGHPPRELNTKLNDLITGFNNEFEISHIDNFENITSDETTPKESMFMEIDGVVRELSYPPEILGSKFYVRKLDYVVVDRGNILDTPAEPLEDMGNILDTDKTTEVLGKITETLALVTHEYEFTFVINGDSNNPTQPDKIINDSILEIMYDSIAFDDTQPLKVMNLNLKGVLTRLTFASEYTGKPFVIIKDNENFTSVFTESLDHIVI